jgi:hypothetical protein
VGDRFQRAGFRKTLALMLFGKDEPQMAQRLQMEWADREREVIARLVADCLAPIPGIVSFNEAGA